MGFLCFLLSAHHSVHLPSSLSLISLLGPPTITTLDESTPFQSHFLHSAWRQEESEAAFIIFACSVDIWIWKESWRQSCLPSTDEQERKGKKRKMWMSKAQEAQEGLLGNHTGANVQIMGC